MIELSAYDGTDTVDWGGSEINLAQPIFRAEGQAFTMSTSGIEGAPDWEVWVRYDQKVYKRKRRPGGEWGRTHRVRFGPLRSIVKLMRDSMAST